MIRHKKNISIHALLAESDSHFDVLAVSALLISIHALLAESDLIDEIQLEFNSLDFYPRSPCGERRCAKRFHAADISISIHALLAESDLASRLSDMSAA